MIAAMPADVTLLDFIALALFVLLWGGYASLLGVILRRHPTANQHLDRVRRTWMLRMLQRENRIADTALLGATIRSVSFFASTTILITAGLIGVLGGSEQAHRVIQELSIAWPTSRGFFEWKVLLILSICVYVFFKFTWSLRQFNYTCALIGATPPPQDTTHHETLADAIGEVLTQAIKAFNAGLRGYYFALAVLAWFIHPIAWMLASLTALAVLLRRQIASPTARAIAQIAATLPPPSSDRP